MRDTIDVVESEGVSRRGGAADVADLILLVVRPVDVQLGAATTMLDAQRRDTKRVVVANKSDLPRGVDRERRGRGVGA